MPARRDEYHRGGEGFAHGLYEPGILVLLAVPSLRQAQELFYKECPRISDEFLKRERRRMPMPVFESEYFCSFTDAIDSVFRFVDIMAAFTDEIQPMFQAA